MAFGKQFSLGLFILLLGGCLGGSRVVDFGDGHYEGDFDRKGQRHGDGTYNWNNGDSYVGQFRYGKRHGQGEFVWANGDRFSGDYRNGKRHGRGSYEWSNGSRYDGQYAFGKRHGRGTFLAADGTRYDGWWRDDQEEGHGVLTNADGRRVEGKWSRGELKSEVSSSDLAESPPNRTGKTTDDNRSGEEPLRPPTPSNQVPPVANPPETTEVPEASKPTPSQDLPPIPGEPVAPIKIATTPEPKPNADDTKQEKAENWKGTQEQAESYFESREKGEVSALHVKETGKPFDGSVTIVLENGAKRGQVTVKDGLLHGEETLWGEDGEIVERNLYEQGKLVQEQIVPAPE